MKSFTLLSFVQCFGLTVSCFWCDFSRPVSSQVTVGYRNPVVSSASVGLQLSVVSELTNQLNVVGDNVVPVGGGDEFDRRTQWVVRDPQQGFAISVEDLNPLIKVQSSVAETQAATVSRRELLPVVISGPAAEALRSVFPVAERLEELELFRPSFIGF